MVAGVTGAQEALAVHRHKSQLLRACGDVHMVNVPLLQHVGARAWPHPERHRLTGAVLQGLQGLRVGHFHDSPSIYARANDMGIGRDGILLPQFMEWLDLPVDRQQDHHGAENDDPDGSSFVFHGFFSFHSGLFYPMPQVAIFHAPPFSLTRTQLQSV